MSLEDFGWRIRHCDRLQSKSGNENPQHRCLPVVYNDPTAIVIRKVDDQIAKVLCKMRKRSGKCQLNNEPCQPQFFIPPPQPPYSVPFVPVKKKTEDI